MRRADTRLQVDPAMTIPCTCGRPLSAAVKVGEGVGQCPCGRKWYRMTLAAYAQMRHEAARVDYYNRAMRTSASRLKFAKTGRV